MYKVYTALQILFEVVWCYVVEFYIVSKFKCLEVNLISHLHLFWPNQIMRDTNFKI